MLFVTSLRFRVMALRVYVVGFSVYVLPVATHRGFTFPEGPYTLPLWN